jgi:hypothetical protein
VNPQEPLVTGRTKNQQVKPQTNICYELLQMPCPAGFLSSSPTSGQSRAAGEGIATARLSGSPELSRNEGVGRRRRIPAGPSARPFFIISCRTDQSDRDGACARKSQLRIRVWFRNLECGFNGSGAGRIGQPFVDRCASRNLVGRMNGDQEAFAT